MKIISKSKLNIYAFLVFVLSMNIKITKAVEIVYSTEHPEANFTSMLEANIFWFLRIFILTFILLIILKSLKYIKSNNKEEKVIIKKNIMFYAKIIIIIFIAYFLIPLFVLLIE